MDWVLILSPQVGLPDKAWLVVVVYECVFRIFYKNVLRTETWHRHLRWVYLIELPGRGHGFLLPPHHIDQVSIKIPGWKQIFVFFGAMSSFLLIMKWIVWPLFFISNKNILRWLARAWRDWGSSSHSCQASSQDDFCIKSVLLIITVIVIVIVLINYMTIS